MSENKIYYFSTATRFMIIVPSLCAIILSLWLLSINNFSVKPIPLVVFCGILASFAIYCCILALLSRLVITPNGIVLHRFIPFHRFVAWSKVERIFLNPLNEIDLIYASDKRTDKKQIISITAFNAAWSNANFLSIVREVAPHVEISVELLNFRIHPFLYRSGTLLIYYCLVMPLGLIPVFLFPQIYLPHKGIFDQAFIGVITSSMGGMLGLLVYGTWKNRQSEYSLIKKVVTLYYLVPLSGFVVIFLISFLFDIVSGHQRLPGFILMVLGLVQLEILLRVVGFSVKTMLLTLDKG